MTIVIMIIQRFGICDFFVSNAAETSGVIGTGL